MASREEVIKLTIESAEAAKSVKEVRESLKAIRNQMLGVAEDSQEFHQLAAAAAELKDRVNDANEAMAAMHPDGFQAVVGFAQKASGAVAGLQGAMALFGGESEEVQKTMMKLQAAMALTQGLESLKDMTKAWRALNAVIAANPVLAIVAAVLALAAAAAAVYDWFVEQNSEAAKLEEQAKQIEAVETRKAQQLDYQLKILKAQGASEDKIYQTLLKQLDAKLKIALANLNAARQRARESDFEEEEMEALRQASIEYENLLNEKQVAQIEYQNWVQGERDKELEKEKAQSEKVVAIKRKEFEEKQKHEQAIRDMMIVSQQELDAENEAFVAANEKRIADQQAADDARRFQTLENEKADMESRVRLYEFEQKLAAQRKALEVAVNKARLDLAKDAFGALGELAGKNAKLQKAFAVAETTIATYQAAQQAYLSQLALATPDAPIRAAVAAGIAIASGLARVAAIVAVNEKGGGGGSVGGGGGGMGGGMGLAQINDQPNINSAAQPSTLLDQQGNVLNSQGNQITAQVAVTEINEVNNNVQVVENLARF